MPNEICEEVFVALGSNLGDREKYLKAGLDEMACFAEIISCSSFINTAPVGCEPGQGDYLNGVVQIRTCLSPQVLLRKMLEAELKIGRVRGDGEIRWGARVIDLDLILYGPQIVVQPPELILPHPRMHQREFVLAPLCEISPNVVHPLLQKSAAQLLSELRQN